MGHPVRRAGQPRSAAPALRSPPATGRAHALRGWARCGARVEGEAARGRPLAGRVGARVRVPARSAQRIPDDLPAGRQGFLHGADGCLAPRRRQHDRRPDPDQSGNDGALAAWYRRPLRPRVHAAGPRQAEGRRRNRGSVLALFRLPAAQPDVLRPHDSRAAPRGARLRGEQAARGGRHGVARRGRRHQAGRLAAPLSPARQPGGAAADAGKVPRRQRRAGFLSAHAGATAGTAGRRSPDRLQPPGLRAHHAARCLEARERGGGSDHARTVGAGSRQPDHEHRQREGAHARPVREGAQDLPRGAAPAGEGHSQRRINRGEGRFHIGGAGRDEDRRDRGRDRNADCAAAQGHPRRCAREDG